MKAAVLTRPGASPPSACFTIDPAYPKPTLPSQDWVLIRVRAAGLNRAELRSRHGFPGHILEFNLFAKEYRADPPKVIGEEMVGEVEKAGSNTEFKSGDKVVAWMFGGGKAFDGSYAEYAISPEQAVVKLETSLPWEVLGGAVMSMWTAHGALDIAAQMKPRSLILIHGASSSVGIWSIILAKDIGCTVVATTRNKSKIERLKLAGADYVVLEDELKETIPKLAPKGFDTWFEIVGPENINPLALSSTARHGTVVHAGILSLNFSMGEFSPTDMGAVRKLTFYTTMPEDYDEGAADFVRCIIDKVERGVIKAEAFMDRVFSLQQIGEAHEYMENNKATGKVVITV
ncbi:NAD(P)-binding protein [Penicillium pulvis]|uniref:NAD(P)-binding protein n=1 Tax=Penicillium pulvis TaxID=1562058 RepID=UPI002548D4F2|nr:NAD(P)-binding protein [Penicillium pulvis]KAJ5801958.1 NAD(P)-binding protein [Penicillium pulvis]